MIELFRTTYYRIKNWASHKMALRGYRRYIKGLRSTCPEIRTLTKEQKESIQAYFKKYYGEKIPDYLWHEYYYTRNGIFSERYIPNYVLLDINRALYNSSITTAFDDKNLYYTIFPDIRQPKAYLKCINGLLYDGMNPETEDEAVLRLKNLGVAIIKPTFCSCNGNGVKHLNIIDGVDRKSNKSIRELMSEYGKNYVVQEAIQQHRGLSALCPSSVNTIRIVTYRRAPKEVVVIYAVMRIGKFGSEVDNTSAGGMTCCIDIETGKLKKYAICSKPAGNFDRNEAGLVFEEYQVPCFDKVVEQAKKMHFRLPHFPMIGWDFTVDTNDDVVFVEMNAPFGLHQPAAGPGYGKYTDEIMERCFGKR